MPGQLMTTPGQTIGVSVFLDPIIADLGLSRSLVSLLYLLGTLSGSLILPFIGRLIDRRGPRVAVGAISGFATTLMVAGTAGPLLFALGFERFDAYAPTLTLALLAPLAVGIVALWSELRSHSRH